MTVHTLLELNDFLRQVVALNFQQPLWVTAEIGEMNLVRGHFFLDLVQHGEGGVVAQASAVLWQRDQLKLRKAHGKALDEILREGMQVKFQVRVEYHERYGLKFIVADVEPEFTFGQLELARLTTIRVLHESGLLRKNAALALPPVLQRIAVVTSETAAGWQDFREHLASNAQGYGFDLQVFASAMQGKNVETELPAALARVAEFPENFDCCVVLRGGGARLDLAAFDGLEVCRAVANCPLPVLSGIGHDVDETVLDLTAHTALKTPTAVADFLIARNFQFENELLRAATGIQHVGLNLLKIKQLETVNLEQTLRWRSRERLQSASWQLDQTAQSLPVLASQTLRSAARKLAEAEAICRANDPAAVLRRGFSLTLKNGRAVTSVQALAPGDVLETLLADGRVLSKVENS